MFTYLYILLPYFLLVTSATKPHPLYISNTNIEYNSKAHTVEMINKIFVDDLEASLTKIYNRKIDLFANPNNATKQLLLDYIQKHIILTINNQPTTYTIVGYERQKEACWCYIEIPNITSVNKLSLTNTILYEYTDKQINLNHIIVNGVTKNTKLQSPETTAVFTF